MLNHLPMMPRICFAPEGGAAGTPSGDAPPAGGAAAGGEPQTPTAPWHGAQGTYMIGEGEAAQPWWSGIQEEPIRDFMKAKNYSTPDEAARAAWNANKLLNERGNPENQITIPGKEATPEEWNSFLDKMGRPPSPDKYELKNPEGVQVDEKLLDFGKNLFHKLGASPERAQQALDEWNKFAAEAQTAMAEQMAKENDAALDALTKSWGEELEANRAAGERVMRALDLSPEAMDKLEGAIGSAAVVEMLAKIGRQSDEGGLKVPPNGGGDPNDASKMSPAQAQARIAELNSDAEFQKKYTDKTNAGHKDALKLMESLYAKAQSKPGQ